MAYKLIKTETHNRITYESAEVTIILWKNNEHLRIEISKVWPVGECSNWQEFAQQIELESIIIIPAI